MGYKWLIWGVVIFIISGLGWFVAVVLNVVTLGGLRFAANIFGYIAAASIPVSIVLAIIDRKKK
ncbi:hypothetical protein A3C73_01475 [Candidatus Giovannonibacteria bacterium RIFCSPHIGHO2_02_FULL_44_11]|uniref:DUF378 domain-containing protein n=1 Tax=Candidatus Yanofskybacteria bacterium RIFCSPLOWO2_01_FULL_49_25 TaxID=1802701 RepID=A0A1F8GW41_9BACT|nr:MAG: hypothetical protein A3C73_01475 [Candidatus Giovannonibacteria bacterium RIFCSPHIGHO2_02_FULL_44_11]OGN29617.1 MAG: hypothetical protein A3A33_05225 [Candidatus Yanofskybacteria bacterium RIFCSPLOWO2_01_FULL_49_25]